MTKAVSSAGSVLHQPTSFVAGSGVGAGCLTEPPAVQVNSIYQKLRCGVRGPNGLSAQEVAENQRTRIYEAMVEIAATRGYPATTIKAVCGLARVSRQTFYDLFSTNKDACFLGAYDYVVARAVARISRAYRKEPDPQRRLCRAFQEFAQEAAGEPLAARFALVETLGAGRAAQERMNHGRQLFQELIAASLSDHGGAVISPRITRGIVGGVERVSRVYLLDGRIDELAGTAGELAAWVSSYRPWTRAATPAAMPTGAHLYRPAVHGRDEGLRIARAAAAIAASQGYGALSVARIVRAAGVSEETFNTIYGGPDALDACFLAAFDLLGAEALVCAARASREAGGWPGGVRSGIAALLDHIAGDPCLGRVAFVEIFAAGPAAIERRSRMLGRFADIFVKYIPDAQRPSELIAEAIVGAVWALIHDYVVRGQTQRLHELADDVTYLALAPVIGHQAAVQEILAGEPALAPALGGEAAIKAIRDDQQGPPTRRVARQRLVGSSTCR